MSAGAMIQGLRSRGSRLARSSKFWARVLLPVAEAYRAMAGEPPVVPKPVRLTGDTAALAAALRLRKVETFGIDKDQLRRQDAGIAARMDDFFDAAGLRPDASHERTADHVAEYRKLYPAAPITNNAEGANFPGGLALFLLVRRLRPNIVVESGVYKGLSSFILACAAPNAQITAFDVDLSRAHRTPGVRYHECDWMQVDVKCNGDGFVYFDDHVNQARRVIEARARGFRYLLFDDSWPLETIFGTGAPPLPTIDMVMADDLKAGAKAEWADVNSHLRTYVHTPEIQEVCAEARAHIKAVNDVPTLYRQTGIAPTSARKFVTLS